MADSQYTISPTELRQMRRYPAVRMKIGQKKNMLTLLEYMESRQNGARMGKFLCDCGKTSVVRISGVRNGTPISCGCKVGWSRKLPPGVAAFNLLLKEYQKSAMKRGLKFELTREEFLHLTQGDCYYCGARPRHIYRGHRTNKQGHSCYNGGHLFNGVDRKDNAQGYLLNNCVPCCRQCNTSKLSQSYEGFVERCRVIVERHNARLLKELCH